MKTLDEKGRCCGRKPLEYKRPHHHFFCSRCNREYDRAGNQVANWAWVEASPGKFKEKRYQDIDTEELLNVGEDDNEDSEG